MRACAAAGLRLPDCFCALCFCFPRWRRWLCMRRILPGPPAAARGYVTAACVSRTIGALSRTSPGRTSIAEHRIALAARCSSARSGSSRMLSLRSFQQQLCWKRILREFRRRKRGSVKARSAHAKSAVHQLSFFTATHDESHHASRRHSLWCARLFPA